MLGFAGESLSFVVSAQTEVVFTGGLTNIDATVPGVQDPTKNLLTLRGAQTSEVGVSIAGNVEILGIKMSLGVTPKVVSVNSLVLSESLATVDTGTGGLLDEDASQNLGSFTTLDARVMIGLTDNIKLGVMARNLVSDGFVDTSSPTLRPVSINFDTQLRAGVAYNGDTFTIGADLDLTENDPVIRTFGAQPTRVLSVGAELDVFDIVQLRAGMQKNLAAGSNNGTLLTAGVGLSFSLHIDLAVIADSDAFGAYLQTDLRF